MPEILSMVELKNIYKSYKNTQVFIDLSFKVSEGQILGIIGKNGSGKTTLLRIISGLESADSGNILVFKNKGGIEMVGISLCEEQLIEEMDGGTYLNFIGRIYKIKKKLIEGSIIELSAYFDFEDALDKPIKLCSAGTKKKLSICSSLIHKPKLLLMDEPFENLDDKTCEKLLSFLKQFNNQDNSMIITSSKIDYLMDLSTRIGIISNYGFSEFSSNSKADDDVELKAKIISAMV